MSKKSASLLLVEPSAQMRALLAGRLRRAGHEVVEAAGAEDALTWLGAGGRPDVVIADVGPLGEYELLRWIRARAPAIAVVLTVGLGDRLALEHAHALGAAAVVSKPFDIDELLRLVRELCSAESLVA